MTLRSAAEVTQALARAQGVGIVEEPFTLMGIPLVVRSLRPDEHAAIIADCKDLDDVDYLNAFQKGHVSRALVEIDGCDVRGLEYIEEEVIDEKTRKPKKVRHLTHRWITDKVLSTWGREAIYVAYLKVADAITTANKRSREGVQFVEPIETPEETLRRQLGELAEVWPEVPEALLDSVLKDYGLQRVSTSEEVEQALGSVQHLSPSIAGDAEPAPAQQPTPEPPVDWAAKQAEWEQRARARTQDGQSGWGPGANSPAPSAPAVPQNAPLYPVSNNPGHTQAPTYQAAPVAAPQAPQTYAYPPLPAPVGGPREQQPFASPYGANGQPQAIPLPHAPVGHPSAAALQPVQPPPARPGGPALPPAGMASRTQQAAQAQQMLERELGMPPQAPAVQGFEAYGIAATPVPGQGVALLEPQPPIDPAVQAAQARSVMETLPTGGINVKYRPPPTRG